MTRPVRRPPAGAVESAEPGAEPGPAVTIRVAALIALAVALLATAWVLATRSTRGYRHPLVAVLPHAHGVREGTPVTYLGLQFGHVRRLRVEDGRVVAELRIREMDPPLRRGDSLRVRTFGLLGDRVLDVVPARSSGPPLGTGDTIFVSVTPQVPIEDVLEAVRRVRGVDSPRAAPQSPPR